MGYRETGAAVASPVRGACVGACTPADRRRSPVVQAAKASSYLRRWRPATKESLVDLAVNPRAPLTSVRSLAKVKLLRADR